MIPIRNFVSAKMKSSWSINDHFSFEILTHELKLSFLSLFLFLFTFIKMAKYFVRTVAKLTFLFFGFSWSSPIVKYGKKRK